MSMIGRIGEQYLLLNLCGIISCCPFCYISCPLKVQVMADIKMSDFTQTTEIEYVYAEAADGSQVKIKKNDLIREKYFYMEVNQEIDLGFNTSALLCIKAPQLTGSLAVVLAFSNSVYFSEISNNNDVYVFTRDQPDKVCIYKTEEYGNIKVKNLTNKPTFLIVSIL